jgi:hypothetical protein
LLNVIVGGVNGRYFKLFELNDTITRNKFKEAFPHIICDERINTLEVIDSKCLRFIFDNKLYEYKGLNNLVEVENVERF